MGISPSVNFLPWRRIQFHRCLQRWGLRVCMSWLICGGMAFYAAGYWQAERQVSEIHRLAERQIHQQLVRRDQQLKANAQQRARAQKRRAMKEATQAWSPRLFALSKQLPKQAWLNALSYRRGTLSLTGALTQFSALSVLEQELQRVSGFMPGKAGKIHRGSDGFWQFQYQLSEAVHNAAP